MNETGPVSQLADGAQLRIGDWGPWIGLDPETCKRTHPARVGWYPAGDMDRAVVFQPGYRTDRKSFGQHGMDITWLLRGPRGVTQFVIFTQWMPGDVGGIEHRFGRKIEPPMAADLGYHARCPQYEGYPGAGQECDYLDGLCYYDGSGLNAEELFKRFAVEGEPAIWQTLAEYHDELVVPE